MLKPHREQRRKLDVSSLIVSAYSVLEIKAFNRQHDLTYGWHPRNGFFYSNLRRLPETFCGKLEDLWNRPTPATPTSSYQKTTLPKPIAG